MPDPPSRGDDWTGGVVVGWPLGLLTSFAPFLLVEIAGGVTAGECLCVAVGFWLMAAASLPFGLVAGWAAVRFRDARGADWPAVPTAGAGAYLAGMGLGVVGLIGGRVF